MVAVAAKPGRLIPAGTEERLARFTELVATAVSNATTRTELLTSRARLVSAADETRRRLERDLHDGIQQWLVALALRARKAASLATASESAVRELSRLADDLVAVIDELREISRGIHPAILSDAGLDDALKALARRSALRVALDVNFEGRYEPPVEATVYYVVAESITNAVKHAQASVVAVRGSPANGAIELEIEDDGVGGADLSRGSGIIGLKDRDRQPRRDDLDRQSGWSRHDYPRDAAFRPERRARHARPITGRRSLRVARFRLAGKTEAGVGHRANFRAGAHDMACFCSDPPGVTNSGVPDMSTEHPPSRRETQAVSTELVVDLRQQVRRLSATASRLRAMGRTAATRTSAP